MESAKSSGAAQTAFEKMRVDSSLRHAFLCIGPECCDPAEGLRVWEILKSGTAAAGCPVLRSKAACLRICSGGPWLLVYPEGVWYGGVTMARCERIVAEHLLNGTPVVEWIARVHPLCADVSGTPPLGNPSSCQVF